MKIICSNETNVSASWQSISKAMQYNNTVLMFETVTAGKHGKVQSFACWNIGFVAFPVVANIQKRGKPLSFLINSIRCFGINELFQRPLTKFSCTVQLVIQNNELIRSTLSSWLVTAICNDYAGYR